jgi:hypothetical protein
MASFDPVPLIRRNAVGEQKHLHHGSAGEDLHDGAGRHVDFGGRFAHIDAGDFFDLLFERVGVVCEQLPVKLLHLSGTGRALGQGFLGG